MAFINKQKLNRTKPLGIRAPIRNAALDGVFDVNTITIEQVKSELYVLLFTSKGSRVQLPEFGSPVYDLQFEQVSQRDFPEIGRSIEDAIARWVPKALVNDVEITQLTEAPNTFEIVVRFSLRDNPRLEDSLVITAR